jgi:hypothetical protein
MSIEPNGYRARGNGGLVITDLRTPEEIARQRRRDHELAMDIRMRAAHWAIDEEMLGYRRPLPRP